MKSIQIACASLALVAACSRASDKRQAGTADPSTFAAYAAMDRMEFIQAIERELEAIDKQFTALEQKLAAAGATATAASRSEVASLGDRRAEIEQKLAGLKTSLDKGPEELRRAIVDSCRQVRDALTKLLQGP